MPRDDEGADAIEYSLMAGLIAVAIAAAVGAVGTGVVVFLESVIDGVGW